jgi:hypothetical protein
METQHRRHAKARDKQTRYIQSSTGRVCTPAKFSYAVLGYIHLGFAMAEGLCRQASLRCDWITCMAAMERTAAGTG